MATTYSTYRLVILQKSDVQNVLDHLIDLMCSETDCVEILDAPTRGATRSAAGRGLCKWVNGRIRMKTENDCYREFTDRTSSDPYFNIRLKI